MQIFDAHCDTATELINQKQKLDKNSLHIDMEKLEQYDSFTQVFAVFIAPEYRHNAMGRVEEVLENFHMESGNNNITLCRNYNEWENAKTKVKAFLSLEGGEPIESLSDVKKLYDMGIRMIAPTWNHRNKLACGVEENEDTGLTDFGASVIQEMGRLGIILDVSHLSDMSFYQALALSKGPVCASHSCSRTVVNHKRNLTDEQFTMIKKTGGVVGINLYPPFLGEDISWVKRHIDHFLSLGGEDNIGLGCDFDGVDRLPDGVGDVRDIRSVIKSLPYSDEIKEKIAYKNFMRVINARNW